MIAVRDHLERFGDATVVVVTFSAPERLAAYRARLQIPFALLSDPDRRLYRLLGAQEAKFRDLWSLGTLRLYVRLVGVAGYADPPKTSLNSGPTP